MSTVSTAGAETMGTAVDLRDAVPVRVIVLGAGVAACAAALASALDAHGLVVPDRGDRAAPASSRPRRTRRGSGAGERGVDDRGSRRGRGRTALPHLGLVVRGRCPAAAVGQF